MSIRFTRNNVLRLNFYTTYWFKMTHWQIPLKTFKLIKILLGNFLWLSLSNIHRNITIHFVEIFISFFLFECTTRFTNGFLVRENILIILYYTVIDAYYRSFSFFGLYNNYIYFIYYLIYFLAIFKFFISFY